MFSSVWVGFIAMPSGYINSRIIGYRSEYSCYFKPFQFLPQLLVILRIMYKEITTHKMHYLLKDKLGIQKREDLA